MVASFSILGDMVEQVGGKHIALHVLVGPNSDAHSYQPTPQDTKALAHADLVVINGLELEGWMARLIRSSGFRGKLVIASEGIAPLNTQESGDADPHAWQNIANGKRYVMNIRDALMALDSKQALHYRANATRYLKKLDALERWVKAEIGKIPLEKRKVVTSHQAFQYFAVAYGVRFIAPVGVNADAEATAQDIARLIDQLRARHVKAVFMENISDGRLMRQLEKDADAYLGGTLYSDALSDSNGPAASYIAMVRHNVTELTKGMAQ